MAQAYKESFLKRVITWISILYMIPVGFALPYLNWQYAQTNGLNDTMAFGQVVPTLQALLWPAMIQDMGTAATAQHPLAIKADKEFKKFNVVWYYLAAVNRAEQKHSLTHPSAQSFLASCYSYDDYLSSLHRMIYASRTLDTVLLNSIYPELGTQFKNLWVKGADIMLDACITGSTVKFQRSVKASDEWDLWYNQHSQSIEEALKTVSH